ncbi:MAG: hypothetical protein IKO41_21530 [Lachnospiraceae bacterium]|nr:hypothetical protein [Lachnospiraceae bacterium]
MLLVCIFIIALLIVSDVWVFLNYLAYSERKSSLLQYEAETEARLDELNAMLDRCGEADREQYVEKKYKMLLSLLERYKAFMHHRWF